MTEIDETTTRLSDDTPARGARRKLVVRSILPCDETSLELDGTRWTLGRGEGCDLRLPQAGTSRHHAELGRRGPSYSIRDLGSTNGTHVNGAPVTHFALAEGAIVRLGEWLGVVEAHDAEERGPYHFRELAPGVFGGALLARALEPLLGAARSTVPVVLVGRTGTGKERFARALHLCGASEHPFHAVNCAALPTALAEAELFGYRRGAFTGAERPHDGHLRAAGQGILFLDEVAELPLPIQAKLLRALDTGELSPIGETARTRFQARVVAACQVPLGQLVAMGTFREDLAARLSGLVVTLPELAARRGDIPALFHAFLHKYSAGTAPEVSTQLYEALSLQGWPANVRELEQLARQLLAVHGLEPVLRRRHLPAELRTETRPSEAPRDGAERTHSVERLARALQGTHGNVKQAAADAGISRQRAYRLINSARLDGVVATSRESATGGEGGRGD